MLARSFPRHYRKLHQQMDENGNLVKETKFVPRVTKNRFFQPVDADVNAGNDRGPQMEVEGVGKRQLVRDRVTRLKELILGQSQDQSMNEVLVNDLQAVEKRVDDLEARLDTVGAKEDNAVEELDYEYILAQPRQLKKPNQCTII